MSKPNVSTESVLSRFTAIQNHLKEITNEIDHVRSLPFIPSHRMDQLAFLQDKVDNLNYNVHQMQQALAHLG